jgi:hypothetical protein
MVTELLCNATGGPELVTSKGFEEAKLGVSPGQWNAFVALAAEVARVWPTQRHRDLVLRALEEQKAHFCAGLVAEEGAASADTVANGQVAMFGEVALDGPRCPFMAESSGGRPTLELPPGHPAIPGRGSASEGRCPFRAASSGSPSKKARVDEFDESRQVSIECKVFAISDAATMFTSMLARWNPLNARKSEAKELGDSSKTMRGRVLGSSLQERLDKLCEEDPELCCPVSLLLLREPVIASDGFIYESDSLKELDRRQQVSPLTREALDTHMSMPAKTKKAEVMAFREKRATELLHFAEDALKREPQMAITALDRVQEYLAVLKPSGVPGIAARAAVAWSKTDRPMPEGLRPFLRRT